MRAGSEVQARELAAHRKVSVLKFLFVAAACGVWPTSAWGTTASQRHGRLAGPACSAQHPSYALFTAARAGETRTTLGVVERWV
jgi:hypothetical protein